MKIIEFENAHRRKHFELFQSMEMPHFSLVAPVQVGRLREYIADQQLHFSGTMVYLLSRTANEIREFRWRIRGSQVVEHAMVHPSFTVSTEGSDVFSYCYVDFTRDYHAFINAASAAQQRMRSTPSLDDTPGKDDYLFMSSIPWVHFTGFMHAMHVPVHDSVPRITWGKIGQTNGDQLMPVGVQVHHGVVDGRHVGMFYERLGVYCEEPERLISL